MKESSKQLIRKVSEVNKNLSSFQLDVYSSGAAFFIFISVIPFFLIMLYIIPRLSLSQDTIIQFLFRIVPEDFKGSVGAYIRELYNQSHVILPISVISLFWSASRGIIAITKGLNKINNVEETRNYFVVRGIGILYVVILIVGVVLTTALGVFGRRFFAFISNDYEVLYDVIEWIYHYSDLILILVIFILFLFFYKVLPAKHIILRHQIPGALFSSIVWWGFTQLFSLYILNYNAFSIYGSIALIIIFLLWLYAGMYFLLIGAWINYRISLK